MILSKCYLLRTPVATQNFKLTENRNFRVVIKMSNNDILIRQFQTETSTRILYFRRHPIRSPVTHF
jgi:hypothetical protein